MDTRKRPETLVMDLTSRSLHNRYHLAAVIFDNWGIFSWGWNHDWTHAEIHAIRRANPKRLNGAIIIVAGVRGYTGRILLAKPCAMCLQSIRNAGIKRAVYSDPNVSRRWNALTRF